MKALAPKAWLTPFHTHTEMGAAEYAAAFEPTLPRRTAINRLNRLLATGHIERLGQTRATIYRLLQQPPTSPPLRYAPPVVEDCMLREESPPMPYAVDHLIEQLRRPVSERPVVGYQQSFLKAYIPNQTYYLPGSLRMKLMSIGRQTGMEAEPAGTYARHVCQRLLIDLSWNSSRLEGNTYSLLETEQLFKTGHGMDGEFSREAVMILNHKAAIEFLLEASHEVSFDRRTIFNLHALLTADLLRDPGAEGTLRSVPVGIGKSSYLPIAIPAQIETFFDLILKKAGQIADPYEQAFFTMVHLPYLQPFLDGNKRVSRLVANMPLFQRNLAPLSFTDVSAEDYTDAMLAVYELNDVALLRNVFLHAYERSAQRYTVIRGAVGDPDPFRIKYRQTMCEQVAEIIRSQCSRNEAVARLRRWAEESIVVSDRQRFVAAAEETLAGIHEGNFARYRVRPSEFDAWQALWKA